MTSSIRSSLSPHGALVLRPRIRSYSMRMIREKLLLDIRCSRKEPWPHQRLEGTLSFRIHFLGKCHLHMHLRREKASHSSTISFSGPFRDSSDIVRVLDVKEDREALRRKAGCRISLVGSLGPEQIISLGTSRGLPVLWVEYRMAR